MAYRTEIKSDYLITKNSLRATFRPAGEFLDYLESLESDGFHLGTYINLNLYFKSSFVFHLRKSSSTEIEISSNPRGRLKERTFNQSNVFLTLLEEETKGSLESEFLIQKRSIGGFRLSISAQKNGVDQLNRIRNVLSKFRSSEDILENMNQRIEIASDLQTYQSNKKEYPFRWIKESHYFYLL